MMHNLDKCDSLLIRACKAANSHKELIRRLRRIWCIRCGLEYQYAKNNTTEMDNFICQHLFELLSCRKEGFSSYEFGVFTRCIDPVEHKHPLQNIQQIDLSHSHYERVMIALSIPIKLSYATAWDEVGGLIKPLRFRD